MNNISLGFQPDIYHFFESISPFLNYWLSFFFILTLLRLSIFILTKEKVSLYNSMIGEAAGIILILSHTICFCMAIYAKDIFSTILFLWWGPGFLITGVILFLSKKNLINFNWALYGRVTSIACKVSYIIFMLIYWWLEDWSIIFTFSFWIIHDQINLAWFCTNADRTRRTFEDYFLIRLVYIGGLFIPFFINIPNSQILRPIAFLLLLIWAFSIQRLIKKDVFFNRPTGEGSFLRDIIYLPIKK
jgi:hypothetical protein